MIATGASLARLARRCGVPVSARVSRGYSFTVAVDRPVHGPIYLPEARAMCTPHHDGMRVAGMTESLDPDREDIRNNVRSLIASARPLLQRTPVAGVYLAGGHDRWGFTHGPVTGRLLAEQITTGTRPEALRAFDPLRVAVKWRVDTGRSPVASQVE